MSGVHQDSLRDCYKLNAPFKIDVAIWLAMQSQRKEETPEGDLAMRTCPRGLRKNRYCERGLVTIRQSSAPYFLSILEQEVCS